MESTLARLVENSTTNVSQLEMSKQEAATDCVDKERYLQEIHCELFIICCGIWSSLQYIWQRTSSTSFKKYK